MENSQVNENQVLNEKKQAFPEILNIPNELIINKKHYIFKKTFNR